MTDPLLDDVKALLNKDFGDDRILKQIRRACERNEVISNYERSYVRKLAEKHLGKKPEFVQTPSTDKNIIPDVIMPEIQHIPQTQAFQMESPKISYSNSKNKKIFLGLGIVALVIIVASIVSFGGFTDKIDDDNDVPANSISTSFLIETDLKSYNKKDLISINGVSDTLGTVNLSIENQNNKLVWNEQVSLKSDGRFSTLTIAGGPGWESSGTYTIKVDNGVETKSNTFSFTA